jgi:hypothetical protein
VTDPLDAVLACAETALARLLAVFDDLRLSDKPQPWHPTYMVWKELNGRPENYRCVKVLPRDAYSVMLEHRRHDLAARWLAASGPVEALSVAHAYTPTVIGGDVATIPVMRARYTRRGIAPEGLIADILYRPGIPFAHEFDVTWLAYPKDDSLTSHTLALALRPMTRLLPTPDDDVLVGAHLQTWYEDPI